MYCMIFLYNRVDILKICCTRFTPTNRIICSEMYLIFYIVLRSRLLKILFSLEILCSASSSEDEGPNLAVSKQMDMPEGASLSDHEDDLPGMIIKTTSCRGRKEPASLIMRRICQV